jgi:hypothetical protein
MNALRLSSSASMALLTAAVLVALAPSAFADGSGPRHTETVLDAMLLAPAGETLEIDAPLPTNLNLWTNAEREFELELRDPSMISLAALPQGRRTSQPPFIDFSHLEAGGFVGLVDYSAKFKASASFVGGANVRVPVPGLPLGEWGIWGEAFLGYISRDLPFYYTSQSGSWFGAAVGGDYTIVRGEVMYLRAELGVLYAYWNGVNSLDNGMGALAGIQAGFYWIRNYTKAVFTITPQLSYDGKSWIAFVTMGFQVDF